MIYLLGLKTIMCTEAQASDSKQISQQEKENSDAREDLNLIMDLQNQMMKLLTGTSLYKTKELMDMISKLLNTDQGYIGFNNKDIKFLSSDATSGEQILSLLLNNGIIQIKDASVEKFLEKNPRHPLRNALQSNLNTWPDITYIKLSLNHHFIDDALENFIQVDWKKFFGVILFSKEKMNEGKSLSEEELQKTVFVLNINALQNYATTLFRGKEYSEAKISAMLDCLKCFLWSYINALDFRLSAMLYATLEEETQMNRSIPTLKSMKGENTDNFMHYIPLHSLVNLLPKNEDLQRFMNAVDGFGELIRFLFYLGSTVYDSTVEAVKDFIKERLFIVEKSVAEKNLANIPVSNLSKLHVYISMPIKPDSTDDNKALTAEDLKNRMQDIMVSSTINNFIRYEVLLQMLSSFNRLWGKLCKQINLNEKTTSKDEISKLIKEETQQEKGLQTQQKLKKDEATSNTPAKPIKGFEDQKSPQKKVKRKPRVLS